MNTFYKISKSLAEQIGTFEFAPHEQFNPFCGEQVDGTYLVSVDLVERLKDNDNIKNIDWNSLQVINESQINLKQIEL